ncbi:MAG: hypothetical protein ABF291_09200 [Desulfobacterales bacterium]
MGHFGGRTINVFSFLLEGRRLAGRRFKKIPARLVPARRAFGLIVTFGAGTRHFSAERVRREDEPGFVCARIRGVIQRQFDRYRVSGTADNKEKENYW